MKQKSHRVLSLLLAVIMLLTVVPLNVFAADDSTMTLTAESVSAQPGETVDVKVNLSNNKGISSLVFDVSYDEMLTLTDVTFNTEGLGASTMTTTSDKYTNPQKLSIASPTSVCNFNGTVATLSFDVSEDAEESYEAEIALSFDEDNVFDANLDNVALNVVNGKVTVHESIPGDINGDKIVNNKDAVLFFRYVAGWQVDVSTALVDLNGDGSVNNKDAVLLFRFVAGWPVKIDPRPVNPHNLERIDAVEPTCTEDGNIVYWYCADCGKYFSNSKGTKEITIENTVIPAKGHTIVIDPGIPATTTNKGLTEGSHCSECGEVLAPQEEYGPLVPNAANITYRTAYTETTTKNGTKTIVSDSYLATQTIENLNPNTYEVGKGVSSLSELSVDGYDFLGWFESPEVGAKRVYSISAEESGDKILYGVWSEKTNTVTYKLYKTPLEDSIDEKYCSYTTSKGLPNLPNPTINNYVFIGWYDNDGEEVTEIPVGTSGNIVLNAYWTSKRNLAKKNANLDDPIIVEDTDNGVLYYAYELGTIENIPVSDNIWTIQGVAGLSQQKSQSYTTSLTQTKADTISNTISNSTVDSNTWTLSEGWTDTTSVTEEWAEQHGMTVEEANEQCKSATSRFSISNSSGGTSGTTTTDGTTTQKYNSKNTTRGNSAELGAKVSGSYSNEGSASSKIAGTYKVSAEVSGKYEQHKDTEKHTGTDTTDVDTTVGTSTSTWNSASTSESTRTASERNTVTKAISDVISTRKGYGSSYSSSGQNSQTQGFSNTASESVNSSSCLTWSSVETQTTTNTYSTDGKSEGCYRLVMAGKAHVFGVVGYDIATKSYFTYTYSVMDDEVYEFLDYAPDLNFNDCENGVLPFDIPYFVYENSTAATVRTEGLTFRTDSAAKTATVTKYEGTSTDVTIPNYITSGGNVYKVTEISATAFAGKNIRSIILSKFISELPNGAFKNCTSLEQISGYYNVIGDEAFSGCSSLEKYNIPSAVKAVGENAFFGVSKISANVLNSEFALEYSDNDEERAKTLTHNLINSITNSGSTNIILNIANIIDRCELSIGVPEIESFELIGGKAKILDDFQLNSKASNTKLSNLSLIESKHTPLVISSDQLTLDTVNISSNAYCMMLTKDTAITLLRDNVLNSIKNKAVVCKNPVFISNSIDGIAGFLEVFGNMYVYGTVGGLDEIELKIGELIYISEEEFNNYIKGEFTVTFDVNGGNELAENQKNVIFGNAIGELPVPTRDYYTFDGWFTAQEGGEKITENTEISSTEDIVYYAHWTLNPISDWVKAGDMPVDSAMVEQKWTYDLTSYTTSSSSSLSGWTKYDTKITSYTGEKGPVDYDPSNGVRKVRSESYISSYTHHWKYYHRHIGSGKIGTDSTAPKSYRHEIDLTYALSQYTAYNSPTYGHPYGYVYCSDVGTDHLWLYDGEYDVANYSTRWYYQDPVYTYYYKKTEAKEATTDPTGQSNVSNVQKWVKYRLKSNDSQQTTTEPPANTTTHYVYYHWYSSNYNKYQSYQYDSTYALHQVTVDNNALTWKSKGSTGTDWYGSYTCPYCGATDYWIPNYS